MGFRYTLSIEEKTLFEKYNILGVPLKMVPYVLNSIVGFEIINLTDYISVLYKRLKEYDDQLMQNFDDNDWNHLHDCIFHVKKTKSTRNELEKIFVTLPFNLKEEAIEWGMNDTLWRDKFITYYENLIS